MFNTRRMPRIVTAMPEEVPAPYSAVSRASIARGPFKPRHLFGAQFATGDATAPSFKGRLPWATLSLISSAANIDWLSKLTVQAMKSRSNALPTKTVTLGCDNKAFEFFGCRPSWRWRGYVMQ